MLVQLLFAMSCCGLCQNYQIELLNKDIFNENKDIGFKGN